MVSFPLVTSPPEENILSTGAVEAGVAKVSQVTVDNLLATCSSYADSAEYHVFCSLKPGFDVPDRHFTNQQLQ